MSSKAKIPDPEVRARSVAKLREVCRQFDALNLLLDKAIAQAEADIRNSPSGAYRLRKAARSAAKKSAQE